MNLYRISQEQNTGYDTYDSAVVCAADEKEAATLHPSGGDRQWYGREESYRNYDWCDSPERVNVEFIGIAKEGSIKGVVVASFNAG